MGNGRNSLKISAPIEELNIRGPRSSSFWVPGNLSYHIDRQARTSATVLVMSREMRQVGAKHCRGGWGVGRVKTTENKMHWPRCPPHPLPDDTTFNQIPRRRVSLKSSCLICQCKKCCEIVLYYHTCTLPYFLHHCIMINKCNFFHFLFTS